MRTIFVDSINWLEYAKDTRGRLCLLDYPGSGMHGGGPQRSRALIGDPTVMAAFDALLQVLSAHSQELHCDASLTRWHLASIGKIADALANCEGLGGPARTTKQAFGRGFLPDRWGESVESAWANFAEVIGTCE